ncbi:MAG TPA: DUF4037 domain-containing protein [Dehalococcoidia bacterium]|nr:DUF4037 domain-containing protein [Dehalococcoidia bacterium]
MAEQIPGRELARGFYHDVVAPIVGGRPHAAALIGFGSDVLGFDDARSTDHGWGPRLQLFVEPAAAAAVSRDIDAALPETYRGRPVRFGWDDVPVGHHVEIAPLGAWLTTRLGVDPTHGLRTLDWLAMPHQRLAEVTQGPVFHDAPGVLARVRSGLAWYPQPVWLYVLASQWQRISQEEPFVGRASEARDELGSRRGAARLARDIMRLCFMLERRYPPYMKWLGTAFSRLQCAADVAPALERALAAHTFAERETALAAAYRLVGERQNALGITPRVDPEPRRFYGRPFLVSAATEFVTACRSRIDDPRLRSLPLVGSIDQFADSTDLLTRPRTTSTVVAALIDDDNPASPPSRHEDQA